MTSAARKFQRLERPKSKDDIDAIVREVYAAHYILWHAGYTPDEIFVQSARILNLQPVGLRMVVHLRYVGKDENLFTMTLSGCLSDKDAERVCDAWLQFIAEKKGTMSKEALDEYVEGSILRRRFAEILGLLATKGLLHTDSPTVLPGERN